MLRIKDGKFDYPKNIPLQINLRDWLLGDLKELREELDRIIPEMEKEAERAHELDRTIRGRMSWDY